MLKLPFVELTKSLSHEGDFFCAFCLLTKNLKCAIIACPLTDVRARIYYYTTATQFCQGKVDQQSAQSFSHNLVQNSYLTFCKKFGKIFIQGKGKTLKKDFEKNLKKSVDKTPNL